MKEKHFRSGKSSKWRTHHETERYQKMWPCFDTSPRTELECERVLFLTPIVPAIWQPPCVLPPNNSKQQRTIVWVDNAARSSMFWPQAWKMTVALTHLLLTCSDLRLADAALCLSARISKAYSENSSRVNGWWCASNASPNGPSTGKRTDSLKSMRATTSPVFFKSLRLATTKFGSRHRVSSTVNVNNSRGDSWCLKTSKILSLCSGTDLWF